MPLFRENYAIVVIRSSCSSHTNRVGIKNQCFSCQIVVKFEFDSFIQAIWWLTAYHYKIMSIIMYIHFTNIFNFWKIQLLPNGMHWYYFLISCQSSTRSLFIHHLIIGCNFPNLYVNYCEFILIQLFIRIIYELFFFEKKNYLRKWVLAGKSFKHLFSIRLFDWEAQSSFIHLNICSSEFRKFY